ncbi:carnitinyl-CoA dehydratase [Cadophora sp. DSE1049]|nr:carnitinyl-CoA dehydratase [Cadophora sp. DSE1049]
MSAPRSTASVPDWVKVPYPLLKHSLVSFPAKHILLVTINREEYMNCLPTEATIELGHLWKWYDSEPEMRCAVFTGKGEKAFCSGMDLKQRLDIANSKQVALEYPSGSFGGMANRTGKKPIIIACNGHAHGGGFELVLNADVIFASPNATFRLPEVLRGVSALAGGLPRCMNLFGNQRTMDLVLTGRYLSAQEAVSWGLIKEIVPLDKLVDRAIEYAKEIAELSPDAVIISRLGAREAWETGVSRATMRGQEIYADVMMASRNAEEGLTAYKEKRKPNWEPSYL